MLKRIRYLVRSFHGAKRETIQSTLDSRTGPGRCPTKVCLSTIPTLGNPPGGKNKLNERDTYFGLLRR